jgi:phosphoketolase
LVHTNQGDERAKREEKKWENSYKPSTLLSTHAALQWSIWRGSFNDIKRLSSKLEGNCSCHLKAVSSSLTSSHIPVNFFFYPRFLDIILI